MICGECLLPHGTAALEPSRRRQTPPFEGSQYPALGQRKDPGTFCASLPPWTIQILHFLKHHEIPSSTEGQQPGQWHLTAETGGDREALDAAL